MSHGHELKWQSWNKLSNDRNNVVLDYNPKSRSLYVIYIYIYTHTYILLSQFPNEIVERHTEFTFKKSDLPLTTCKILGKPLS